MIVELLTAIAINSGFNYMKNATARQIKNRWNEIVENSKSEGLKNKSGEIFKITGIYPRQYGFYCCVDIPDGLATDSLVKAKKMLEDNLNCVLQIEKERDREYITVKIISKILEFQYSPVQTKSNELFLGHKLDGSKYLLDLGKDPHVLIAGKTGTGKSFIFASILTNLIYFHKKDIDIYLFQKMKGEIDIFKACHSVRFTSDDGNEILIMLKKLTEAIHKRSKQFAEGGIKNISQWNEHFPNKKMKRIIIGIEEISFFMNEENEHFKYFTEIVKAGRSAGVHIIAITQRTTSNNLGGNGEFKSQITVITAKQRSELDSRNAIDISDATYLGDQEFIVSGNDGYVWFKAPKIDEDFKILNQYVPEIKIPSENAPAKEDKKIVISNKLSYEETLKLRESYQCYTLVKNEVVLEPVTEEVKQEVIIVGEELKEAAATAPEPVQRRKKKNTISLEVIKSVKA